MAQASLPAIMGPAAPQVAGTEAGTTSDTDGAGHPVSQILRSLHPAPSPGQACGHSTILARKPGHTAPLKAGAFSNGPVGERLSHPEPSCHYQYFAIPTQSPITGGKIRDSLSKIPPASAAFLRLKTGVQNSITFPPRPAIA